MFITTTRIARPLHALFAALVALVMIVGSRPAPAQAAGSVGRVYPRATQCNYSGSYRTIAVTGPTVYAANTTTANDVQPIRWRSRLYWWNGSSWQYIAYKPWSAFVRASETTPVSFNGTQGYSYTSGQFFMALIDVQWTNAAMSAVIGSESYWANPHVSPMGAQGQYCNFGNAGASSTSGASDATNATDGSEQQAPIMPATPPKRGKLMPAPELK